MAAWKLPLIVIAIAVPIAAAFAAAGPAVGVAVGALVAVAIVIVAARQRPRGAIGRAPAGAARRLLVVVSRPLEEPGAIAEIAAAARGDGSVDARADVLVLAPARIGFLDRWASDVEAARSEAQQRLVISVASLAKEGIDAVARVGDEDLVQAVEDTLRDYAATEVLVITGRDEEDPHAARGAAELRTRLRAGFRRLVVD